MKQARITNVTNQVKPPGFFLDSGAEGGNKMIPAGKSILISYEHELPQTITDWASAGWVSIHAAASGAHLAGPKAEEITAGTVSPIREAAQSDLEDDEPDLSDAREAGMGTQTPAISGDISQGPSSKVRVSLGSENERVDNSGLSPIPGDRPRSVDDSEQFTVKAPRADGNGNRTGNKRK